MYKNILITAANNVYYESLLTLIAGVHRFGLECIDRIFVYDLGLDSTEVAVLSKLKNVEVIQFPQTAKRQHSRFMEPKSHVYKLFCLHDARALGENVLWLDAGVTPIQSMCRIYDIINNDDIFLVVDEHLNKTFTHGECIQIMQATEKELNDRHLSSGILGFKSSGKYHPLITEAYNYSLIPGCVDGDQQNHRHDQSVLSILASRYNCPTQDIDIYGYWTDINRNLNTAKQAGAVIFVHRRSYSDKTGLIYEN